MDTPNAFRQWSHTHLFHHETSKSTHEPGERVMRAHSPLAARALEARSCTHLSAELHNTATAARRARGNAACSCPNPPVDHERSGEQQKKSGNLQELLEWLWEVRDARLVIPPIPRAEEGASRPEITFLPASSPCRNTEIISTPDTWLKSFHLTRYVKTNYICSQFWINRHHCYLQLLLLCLFHFL